MIMMKKNLLMIAILLRVSLIHLVILLMNWRLHGLYTLHFTLYTLYFTL